MKGNMTTVVGTLKFDNRSLNVYSSLDEPIFKLSDIADMLEYSEGNAWNLTTLCEEDEKLKLTMVVAGQRRYVNFVTETGLYNILSQSRKPTARKWRRVIHEQLIKMRKAHNRNIIQQFDEWDHELDTIYIDPETGILMQSITVAGGDVEQVIYRGGQRGFTLEPLRIFDDGNAIFKVVFNRQYTIDDFIDELINKRKDEYGSVKIFSNENVNYIYDTEIVDKSISGECLYSLEYEFGEIIRSTIPNDLIDVEIVFSQGNGGEANINYDIYIK